MKKLLIIGIPIVLIIAAVIIVATRPLPPVATMQEAAQSGSDVDVVAPSNGSTEPPTPTVVSPSLADGRYETYDAELIDDNGYNSTILFFYAAWCPECRAFDQAISAGTVPDGVQILRVTYDDAQDLRQKYGVTIQSTFVRIDTSGDKQVLWNGYGKDKSIDTVIENTK